MVKGVGEGGRRLPYPLVFEKRADKGEVSFRRKAKSGRGKTARKCRQKGTTWSQRGE